MLRLVNGCLLLLGGGSKLAIGPATLLGLGSVVPFQIMFSLFDLESLCSDSERLSAVVRQGSSS